MRGGAGGGEWVCIGWMAPLAMYFVKCTRFLKYSFLMVFHNVAVCPRPPERQWISLQPDRSRNPARELSL